MSAAGNPSSAPTPPDNTLTLSANGGDYTGWQAIRVTRRLEGFCGDFEVSFTDRSTDAAPVPFQVKPFTPCTIKIGGDVVLTGYVDDVAIALTPTSHSVHVRGRGKCEDLIDCSITQDQRQGMQMTTSSLLELATRLASRTGSTSWT
jgi:prophage tail gpP-like protein